MISLLAVPVQRLPATGRCAQRHTRNSPVYQLAGQNCTSAGWFQSPTAHGGRGRHYVGGSPKRDGKQPSGTVSYLCAQLADGDAAGVSGDALPQTDAALVVNRERDDRPLCWMN